MNIPRDTRYRIDTSLRILAPVLATAAVDTAYLLQNRSDLLRMERTIESMQLGVELELMERKPEFSLHFEHMLPYGGMMSNRSEEHTSELQSLMRISYTVFCFKQK